MSELNQSELLRENADLRARIRELESQLARHKNELAQAADSLQNEYQNRNLVERDRERLILRRKQTEEALRQSELRYRSLFSQMSEGFALHEIVFGPEGDPSDYRFLEVNPAFERLTGWKREEVLGRTARELRPQDEPEAIKIYGRVATTGEPAHFEQVSGACHRCYEVFAYSPGPGQFATIFLDITARRRAEESLHESQNRLRLALDSTESGAFDLEPQSGKWVGSEYAKRHFGLSAEKPLQGELLLQGVHPEDRPALDAVIHRVARPEGGGHFSLEFRTVGLEDGQTRWISAKGRVFFDADGKAVRCIGVTVDVTKRKRMEEERRALLAELEKQRSLLSAILNQIPAGVVVAQAPSGRVLLVNEGMYQIAGPIDFEQALSYCTQLQATDRHGKGYTEETSPLARSLLKGESVIDEEMQIQGKDGTTRYLLVNSTAVRDAKGEIIAAVSIAVDITERISIEEALRASEERFRLACDAASEAIWEWDLVSNTVRWNSAYEEITGRAPNELASDWWMAHIHPEDRERVAASLWTALDGPDPFWDAEYRLQTRSGAWAEVYDRASIVRDASGKAIRLIGAMLDLTLRNKAERRLDVLAEIAGELLRAEHPAKVIGPLCQKMLPVVDCDAFFNFLVDEEKGALQLNACGGVPREEARQVEWLDYGVALSGVKAREACRIVAEDLPNLTDARASIIKAYGFKAYACQPLVSGRKILGTLSFASRSKSRFKESELSLLKAAADQVAIAVERRRAQEAQQRAHDLLEQKIVERTAELRNANQKLHIQISERKRAEQELELRERRYRSLVTTSTQVVWVANAAGEIVEDNPAWRELTGQSLEQMKGAGWLEAVHPEDRQRVAMMRAQYLQQHCGGEIEFRVRRYDGEYRYLTGQGVPVLAADGRICEWVGTYTDCTDLRQAQRRRDFISTVLEQFARSSGCKEYLDAVARFTREWTGCDGLGIRVMDSNGELLLESSCGLSAEYQAVENPMAIENSLCLCARVLGQRAGPEERSLLNAFGSLLCSDLRQWSATLADSDRTRPSLRCAECGYASLLVVPIRSGDRQLGLLHLVHGQPGQFSAATVDLVEAISPLLGEAILRFRGKAELSRTNQILRMISECNKAMIQASSEEEFVRAICGVVHQTGGYKLVWLEFCDEGKRKASRLVAGIGFDQEQLLAMQSLFAGDEPGLRKIGAAIRSGQVHVCQDHLGQPESSPWSEEALRCGCRASIALPMFWADRTAGALILYAPRPAAFDPSQVELLKELADDIACGIIGLRAQRERDQALKALEHRTAQLRALASELTRAEERERRRLAQILHDGLQQLLVSARMQLQLVQESCKTVPGQASTQRVDEILEECFETSRTLTSELSPRILYEEGLGPALKWAARYYFEKYQLAVLVKVEMEEEVQSEDVRITLFRAARELLFNAVKHSGTKHVQVHLDRTQNREIRMVVRDKGKGFDSQQIRAREGLSGGFGLFSVRERLELLGGKLEIESAPGKGSRFTLIVPEASRV